MILEAERRNLRNGMRNLYFPADLILNESESAVYQNYPGQIIHCYSINKHIKACKYPNDCLHLCSQRELHYP